MDENAVRWRVWRAALAAGWSWAGTYDWCLHPATRAPLSDLLKYYPDAARRPGPTDPPQGDE